MQDLAQSSPSPVAHDACLRGCLIPRRGGHASRREFANQPEPATRPCRLDRPTRCNGERRLSCDVETRMTATAPCRSRPPAMPVRVWRANPGCHLDVLKAERDRDDRDEVDWRVASPAPACRLATIRPRLPRGWPGRGRRCARMPGAGGSGICSSAKRCSLVGSRDGVGSARALAPSDDRDLGSARSRVGSGPCSCFGGSWRARQDLNLRPLA